MLGKLTPKALNENILSIIKKRRSEVTCSASIGEDCAVFSNNKQILITTDPITSAGSNVGSLAIIISANDIAACGGEPVLAMLTIILPKKSTEEDVKAIMLEAEETARMLNIEIAGGHTEFSESVNKPIVSATVVGFVINEVIKSSTAKVGDSILVTKHIAIEGTYILAHKHNKKLKKVITLAEFDYIKSLLNQISVVEEGRILSQLPVTSMHDITEGGLFGSLIEICSANGLGAEINLNDVPLLEVTKKISKTLKISPYNLISSGSMFFTTDDPELCIKTLKEKGIEVTKIGVVTKSKVIGIKGNEKFEINSCYDEISKF